MLKDELVRKYLGRAYDKDTFHCGSLIAAIYKDFGIELKGIDVIKYETGWTREGENHFEKRYDDGWEKVSDPKFLDVCLFKNKANVPYHGGVMLDEYMFIQCCKQGVIVSRINDKQWTNRLIGFFRLKARKND